MAELVYLVEKGRLPQAAYDELAESLADPEHVFAEAVFTCGKSWEKGPSGPLRG
jgi:hypothetical protein